MEEGEGGEDTAPEQNPQHQPSSLDQTFDLSSASSSTAAAAASTAAEKRVAKGEQEGEDVAALKSEVQRLKEKLQVCISTGSCIYLFE